MPSRESAWDAMTAAKRGLAMPPFFSPAPFFLSVLAIASSLSYVRLVCIMARKKAARAAVLRFRPG